MENRNEGIGPGERARAFWAAPVAFALVVIVAGVGCGARPVSIDAVVSALESGEMSPEEALVSPRFDAIRETPEFRDFLTSRLRSSELTLVREDEPGTPLVVSGRVHDASGRPIAGAEVLVYHTDDRGFYGRQRSDDERGARIYGVLVTDAEGRYEIRTIRPQPYAHAPDTPAHLHFWFRARGYERASGEGPPSLYFEGDPRLVPAHVEEIHSDGAHIAPVEVRDGVHHVTYDFEMKPRADS